MNLSEQLPRCVDLLRTAASHHRESLADGTPLAASTLAPPLGSHRQRRWATFIALVVSLVPSTSGAAPTKRAAPPMPSDTSPMRLLKQSPNPAIRESAALLLGRSANAAAGSALMTCVEKDPSLWVRAACGQALGRLAPAGAIQVLVTALAREKAPALRRALGLALMRLGQRVGLLELMWQLRSGTNHHRAAAMHLLGAQLGVALGDDPKQLWSFLARQGYHGLTLRPAGGPALLSLQSLRPDGIAFYAPVLPEQSQICAQVVRLAPGHGPIDAKLLRAQLKPHTVSDGCLLLILAGAEALPPMAAATTQPKSSTMPSATGPGPASAARRGALPPAANTTATKPTSQPTPQRPERARGLTLDGLRYLLEIAPGLRGVGLDSPHLDAPGAGTTVRDALLAGGRWAIAGLRSASVGRLLPLQRILVVRRFQRGAKHFAVTMLALFP